MKLLLRSKQIQSFHGVRPAVSTPRIFATLGDEVVIVLVCSSICLKQITDGAFVIVNDTSSIIGVMDFTYVCCFR